MSKRRTNAALLRDRLEHGHLPRRLPIIGGGKKAKAWKPGMKVETSHLQSMAQLAGEELIALAAGKAGCEKHDGEVDTVCPWCRGLFQ